MNEREATERALKHYKSMAAADAEYPVNDDLAKHRREAIAALEKQVAKSIIIGEGAYKCPVCRCHINTYDKYCRGCGQRMQGKGLAYLEE